MKNVELTGYRRAKNKKLAIKRKPSDVFAYFAAGAQPFPGTPPSSTNRVIELIGDPPPRRRGNRHRRVEARQKHNTALLESIKARISPAQALKYRTRRQRRKLKASFTDQEWPVVVRYIKTCNRANRAKPGRRLSYETYINSKIWQGVKNRYYQRHPRRCAACLSFKHIQLHHMVYGNFGHEPDEHLVPLCDTHHARYHTENGTQRNMVTRTTAFIEKVQRELRLAA